MNCKQMRLKSLKFSKIPAMAAIIGLTFSGPWFHKISPDAADLFPIEHFKNLRPHQLGFVVSSGLG